MSITDTAYKAAGPVFSGLEKWYLRGPESYYYMHTYGLPSKRRALLTKNALEKAGKVKGYDFGLSKVLTELLGVLNANDIVQFFDVAEMDSKLRDADMEKVKREVREAGFDFCKSMAKEAGPDEFDVAERSLMTVWKLALGVDHKHAARPKEGLVVYVCDRDQYPYKEGAPSRKVGGSFISGASRILHGKSENPRDVAVEIKDSEDGNRVYMYCCDRSWFQKLTKPPSELL
jgi:hypothetical protein